MNYELIILIRNIDYNNIYKKLLIIKNIILNEKSYIVKLENWGKINLSYNIKNNKNLYFIFLNFIGNKICLIKLNKFLYTEKDIIRFIIYKNIINNLINIFILNKIFNIFVKKKIYEKKKTEKTNKLFFYKKKEDNFKKGFKYKKI